MYSLKKRKTLDGYEYIEVCNGKMTKYNEIGWQRLKAMRESYKKEMKNSFKDVEITTYKIDEKTGKMSQGRIIKRRGE